MATHRYLRLANMLSNAIQEDRLVPGIRLPTHRAFAAKFDVALATAARVWGELERRGLILGEAGRGTFVRDLDVSLTPGVRQNTSDGLIDLVFNMPGDAADADMLRNGLQQLATAGDLESMLRYQPHGGRADERRIIAESLGSTPGPLDPERLLATPAVSTV